MASEPIVTRHSSALNETTPVICCEYELSLVLSRMIPPRPIRTNLRQPPVHRIRGVTEFSLWHQPGIQREQMLLGALVITHQIGRDPEQPGPQRARPGSKDVRRRYAVANVSAARSSAIAEPIRREVNGIQGRNPGKRGLEARGVDDAPRTGLLLTTRFPAANQRSRRLSRAGVASRSRRRTSLLYLYGLDLADTRRHHLPFTTARARGVTVPGMARWLNVTWL